MRTFASTFASKWSTKTTIQPEHKGEVYRIKDFIDHGTKAPAAPESVIGMNQGTVGGKFEAKAGADEHGMGGTLRMKRAQTAMVHWRER